MPTTREIETAQQQIHDVLGSRFVVRPNGTNRITPGTFAPENAVRFSDLDKSDQMSQLAFGPPWFGFSTGQALEVIDRVMDGSHPEFWMEGIVASDLKAIFDEVRADEHAARVRDFGEADAAGYADRMAQAYAVQADALRLVKPPGPPITEKDLAEIEREWQQPSTYEKRLAEAASRTPCKPEEKGRER